MALTNVVHMLKRNKPSSKARTKGYSKLHAVKRLLKKLLYPNVDTYEDHHFDEYFDHDSGDWRDYMVKHIPEDKRGGPSRH